MHIAEVDPLTLPSLPLGERKQLPSCPAIYFVMESDRILYIGKTINLAQRLAVHSRQKQFASFGAIHIAWHECSDIDMLGQIETALIKYFKPLLNGTKNPDASKRVNLTLPNLVYKELQAWAEYQGRPTANLAAYLVESAIREAKEKGEFRTLRKRLEKGNDTE
ncbi:XRE family transcriptional regulator (plasmid) [Calothrix sp. NIES-4101]|nr:XRE family transcriptional regulator [Calothrix sp. NIES-4101]